MSRYHCGPLEIRPSEGRVYIEGHAHNKAHVTFARRGIVLVQQLHPTSFQVVRQTQLIAPEYAETQRLLSLYEPAKLKTPYRVPGSSAFTMGRCGAGRRG